ncbi:MAG: YDG domain-containing protein [Oscillospiraceae bacterium]|jgi:hypothetical protein|nr:YDG domain-containing protein [Oscillospiraceae bacterium]
MKHMHKQFGRRLSVTLAAALTLAVALLLATMIETKANAATAITDASYSLYLKDDDHGLYQGNTTTEFEEGEGASWSWDKVNNILTFTDFSFTTSAPIALDLTSLSSDLTLNLVGDNALVSVFSGEADSREDESGTYGIYGMYGQHLIITGSGSLTATGGNPTGSDDQSYGIKSEGSLTISGGTVVATGGDTDYYGGGVSAAGALTISGSAHVTATCGTVGTSSIGISGDSVFIIGTPTVIAQIDTASEESYGICGRSISITGTPTVIAQSGTGVRDSLAIYDLDEPSLTLPTTYIWRDSNSGAWSASVLTVGAQTYLEIAPFSIYSLYFDGGVLKKGNGGATITDGTASADLGGGSYSYEGTTLTLTNVNFITNAATALNLTSSAVTLNLVGDNAFVSVYSGGIDTNTYGINSTQALTISGTGSVTATGGKATGDTKASYGIYAGSTLTINGTARVTATCGSASGSSYGIFADSILTIEGSAIVEATGGTAVGRSYGIFKSENVRYSINISGGTVTARGGTSTGTGSSYGISAHYTQGQGADLTISGGTVIATGGPATGGGDSYGVYAGRNLTISGGTVTATGDTATSGNSYGVYAGNTFTISDFPTLIAKTTDIDGTARAFNDGPEDLPDRYAWEASTNTTFGSGEGVDTSGVSSAAAYSYDTTHKYVKIEPLLEGTLAITVNASNGELTANTRGITNGTSLSYAWSSEDVTDSGSTFNASSCLGEEITLTVSDSVLKGTKTATITLYQVTITPSTAGTGDSVSITNAYGEAGDSIIITYTLDDLGDASNTLTYSGAANNPATVSTVGTPVTATSTYTIAAADATGGTIALTATFAHLSTDEIDFGSVVTGLVSGGKTYGDATVTLDNITSDYGGAEVEYSIVDETPLTADATTNPLNSTNGEHVASISGTTLTILRPGTFKIMAASDGNATYAAASATSGEITVSKKELTITGVTATNRAYNETTSVALVTTSAALSGKVFTDTVTLATPPSTGNVTSAAASEVAKSVTVSGFTVTGADAWKYTLTQPTDVTVTISKATPTYTVPSLTAVYGQTVSQIQGVTTGFAIEQESSVSVGTVASPTAITLIYTPSNTTNYETVTGIAATLVVAPQPITTVNVAGITAPVVLAEPDTDATDGTNWTAGTVSWTPTVTGNKFLGSTTYTATVTLTITDEDYTFTGLTTATFGANTATIGTNTGSTVTLSFAFPATGARSAESFVITSAPTDMEYTTDDTLNLAGMSVTITFDDGTTKLVTFSSTWTDGVSVSPAHGTTMKAGDHNGDTLSVSVSGVNDPINTSSALSVSAKGVTITTTAPSTGLTYGGTLGDPTMGITGATISSPSWTYSYSGNLSDSSPGTSYSSSAKPTEPGTYTVTATLVNDDYSGSGTSANFTIAKKELTVTGVTATNRTYNGGTTVALVTTSAALSGVINSDIVTLATPPSTGTVTTADASEVAKSVTVSGFTVTGAGEWKYTLTQPTGVTVIISKATPSTSTQTINAVFGQTLANLSLPANYAFDQDSTTSVGTVASPTADITATFTPTDMTNYNTVPGIAVTLTVTEQPITSVNVAGITAPVTGATPDTAADATNGDNWMAGTVSWTYGASTPAGTMFLGSTDYTASVTLTANTNYTFTGLTTAGTAVQIGGVNATISGTPGATLVLSRIYAATDATPISAAAITGIDAPTRGGTPDTGAENGTGFTTAIAWLTSADTAHTGAFAASTVYKVQVTLTAASGYAFPSSFNQTSAIAGFTVNSIAPTFVSCDDDELVFTVTFPTTDATPISAAAITGIDAPTRGGTPDDDGADGTGFTTAIAWQTSDGTAHTGAFAASTVYKVQVTLTAASGYAFPSSFNQTSAIAGFTVNSIAPVWASRSDSVLVFTVTFPATDATPPPYIPPTPPTPPTQLITVGDGAVDVPCTVINGVAIIEMTASVMQEILETAKENEQTQVDFNLAGVDGISAVRLPTEAVAIINDANLGIEVVLPDGKLTLDVPATQSVHEQAADTLEIAIAKITEVSQKELNSQQIGTLAVGDTVYDISIVSDNTEIHTFEGAIEITVPYSGKLPVKAWFMGERGKSERIDGVYDAKTGTFTFTVPHLSMWVVGYDETVWPFTDVAEDNNKNWFYSDVKFVWENGLMQGTSDTLFAPQSNMTRAMLWTVLARLSGETITGESWAQDARAWVLEAGVSDGTNPNKFVTRNEIVTMLYRFAGIGEDGYGGEAMAWAAELKIMNDGRPEDTATRAELAAILHRFMDQVVSKQ